MAGADVRRHHDDRVLEVHRIAEPVRQLAVLEDLQQDAEQVRMRLLDLVEQDDRVRSPLDPLRELAAFLVADVAGRRADQLGNGVLLHELRHVKPDQGFLAAEQARRQGARDLGLAHPCRAEEQEGS